MTDFGAARVLLASNAEDFAPTVCAICQQACEKMLKACLLAHGGTFGRTHDLEALGEGVARSVPSLDDLLTELTELSMGYTSSRYPDDLEVVFEESDARQAVETTERLESLLRKHVLPRIENH